MTRPRSLPQRRTHRPAPEDAAPALQWPLAPQPIRLQPGQVHLWAAATNDFTSQVRQLGLLLSPAEQAAAGKFRYVRDRNRYLVRRGLLRLLLGRYLPLPPSAIEFQLGPYGKPELRAGAAAPLFFNASHSADIAVCAITSACPIGVDIERTRKIPDILKIARRYFRPRETETLLALPADARLQAFYACWTRKEAFLKATGEGIAESLPKIEVTLAPQDPPAVVSLFGKPRASEQWQLQPFSPAPGYVGCVAYHHAPLALSQWRVNVKSFWR
jgi:4'-phosphopantetheinyl transferase